MTDITTRARTWILSGYGTGTYTLWGHMMGVKDCFIDSPHDDGDLKRVAQLLELIPEWKARLSEMAPLSPVWSKLAASWPNLSGVLDDIKEQGTDDDRMRAKLTAMMARSRQEKPAWTDEKMRYGAMSFEDRLNAWIVSGDVGVSSKTIWGTMLGFEMRDEDISHPHDPSDLGRCLRLLEHFPEWKPRLRELCDLSVEWAALILRWDEIASTMENEVGIAWEKGKSAPATYILMRTIIEEARKAD
jgi:hypothetical protein